MSNQDIKAKALKAVGVAAGPINQMERDFYNALGTATIGTMASQNANAVAITGGTVIVSAAAPTASAGQVGLGSGTATTVGAAGVASALPTAPTGYLVVNIGGTNYKIPYYNS